MTMDNLLADSVDLRTEAPKSSWPFVRPADLQHEQIEHIGSSVVVVVVQLLLVDQCWPNDLSRATHLGATQIAYGDQ